MVRTLAKISLILLIIVALPIGFFFVRELSALSKNEQMVERVFSTQLESILYSINQYSENVVQHWKQSLDQPIEPESGIMKGLVENLFQNNQAILAVRFSDTTTSEEQAQYFNDSIFAIDTEIPRKKIEVLRGFLEENYQRVEIEPSGDYLIFYFLPKSKNGEQICQLIIDPDLFIQQNLRPTMQKVAQDLFYISISDSISGEVLFETDRENELSHSVEKATMWYLPTSKLGIHLKTKTIEQLASERTQRDNYMLLGMGLFVAMGFIFVFINIRKEMKLAELKSEFVANVSHEIRTPLALISMYAETLLLKRIKTEEKKEEYLKTIQQESTRLTGIVNRILNFSRIEKNRVKYHFENIDLKQVIPEIVHSFDSHFETANIHCHQESFEGSVWVQADRESLKTIVGNLLDNAIKYSDAEKKIVRVRIRKKAKQIWIEVEDNGIGISAKNQKHIFEQFYRVTEGDLAHKAKGSGLGLNLVKRIMKAHGGSVVVRSKLEEGSTFILKFPEKK
ncbi:HAMP domain-containing sensor histidine kinase [uncultured Sunxiuqinia sp.]|uniref:sensor histidine kinase n=1 Tax=uncultured Sunxiuqinia sp. TaxID=1573825 RepID=UPI002AA8110F|nr:HAMP domain-containing sensor histidine kinase [uncultured Sunxiuqinia sp.]